MSSELSLLVILLGKVHILKIFRSLLMTLLMVVVLQYWYKCKQWQLLFIATSSDILKSRLATWQLKTALYTLQQDISEGFFSHKSIFGMDLYSKNNI